ncbi:MAG: hypothetical protein ACD_73C00371G0001, partial [uncultured bacterium]
MYWEIRGIILTELLKTASKDNWHR